MFRNFLFRLEFTVAGVYDVAWEENGSMTLGEWHHLVATWNGTDAFIYNNGKQVAHGIHSGTMDSTPSPVLIGRRVLDMHNSFLNGVMDKLRIYSRAISPEEVRAHYQSEANNYTNVITSQGCTYSPTQNLAAGNNTIEFQTAHNYTNKMNCSSGIYACPAGYNAKVYVKYDTEKNYDYFYIYNSSIGNYSRWSGNSSGYVWLAPNNTNSIRLGFTSDANIVKWGVDVDNINCFTTLTTPLTSTTRTTTTTSTTTSTSAVGCPSVPESYPSDRWDRVWCNRDFTEKLSDVPDQPDLNFDENWGLGIVGGIREDDLGFRSGRTIYFPVGTYVFSAGSDDGIRVWVDDSLMLDKWFNKAYAVDSFVLNLSEGSHTVRIDYFETTWSARVSFSIQPLVCSTDAFGEISTSKPCVCGSDSCDKDYCCGGRSCQDTACQVTRSDLAVILLRNITFCVVGTPYSGGDSCDIHDGQGNVFMHFADDDSFKGLKPSDSGVNSSQLKVCMRTTLNETEIQAIKNEIQDFVSTVYSNSSNSLLLVPRYIEYSGEISLSKIGSGLYPFPDDVENTSIKVSLDKNTDFILTVYDIYDDSQNLRISPPWCGLMAFPCEGAGYAVIPKTTSFWFNCAEKSTFFHEWTHQLDNALEHLSKVPDIFSSYGDYPQELCNNYGNDTFAWFPNPDQAPRDPDYESCQNFYGDWNGYCASILPRDCNEEYREHSITNHYAPETNLIGNHCRDGVIDYDETGTDCGGVCGPCKLFDTSTTTTPTTTSTTTTICPEGAEYTSCRTSSGQVGVCRYGVCYPTGACCHYGNPNLCENTNAHDCVLAGSGTFFQGTTCSVNLCSNSTTTSTTMITSTTRTTTTSTTTTGATSTTLSSCPYSPAQNLAAGDNAIDFQTPHNYTNKMNCTSAVYSCPTGYAAKIYVKYDTEKNYDFLYLQDADSTSFWKYSGNSSGYTWLAPSNQTAVLDKVQFRFTSDMNVVKWGVDADNINCYPTNNQTTTTISTTTTTRTSSTTTSTTTINPTTTTTSSSTTTTSTTTTTTTSTTTTSSTSSTSTTPSSTSTTTSITTTTLSACYFSPAQKLAAGDNAVDFQTPHNYTNKMNCTSAVYSCPTGYAAKVYVKYDTEKNYDFLYLQDADSTNYWKYTGNSTGYKWLNPSNQTAILDQVQFRFTSDVNVVKWGVDADTINCYAINNQTTTTSSTTTITTRTTTSTTNPTTTTSTTTTSTTTTTTTSTTATSSTSSTSTTPTSTSSSTTLATTTSTTTTGVTSTTLPACSYSPAQNLAAGDNAIDFQTPHNYTNKMNCTSAVYSCPAGYTAKVYVKYDTEKNYDFLYLQDADSTNYWKYSGNSSGYIWLAPSNQTAVLDQVQFRFTSDVNVVKWGIDVDRIQCNIPS